MTLGRMKVNVKLVTGRWAQKNTGSITAQNGTIPEAFRKWEQKTKTSEKEWKWQSGIVAHLLSESQWNRGLFSVEKWESKGQVATDGSPLGSARKWKSMWLVSGTVGLR